MIKLKYKCPMRKRYIRAAQHKMVANNAGWKMCVIESPGCFQVWQLIFPSSFHLLHVKHLLMTLSFAQFIHASLKMHHLSSDLDFSRCQKWMMCDDLWWIFLNFVMINLCMIFLILWWSTCVWFFFYFVILSNWWVTIPKKV